MPVCILPKIGPLKVLRLRTPTPETERTFEASFNATLGRYRILLHQVGAGQLDIQSVNLDTGGTSGPGQYQLNDKTHAKLLDALAEQNFAGVSPETESELLDFFGNPDAPYAIERKPKEWAKVYPDQYTYKEEERRRGPAVRGYFIQLEILRFSPLARYC
jgi:hypothetical protein